MADLSLSKIKIGDVTYNLKDADSRSKLATLLGNHAVEVLGSAAWLGADTTVTDGATGVATTAAVKSYVDAQIGLIHKFDVQIYDELPTASAQTMYILGLVADAHAIGSYIEYITVRSGEEGSYTYAWEQIGTTQVDLSNYVQKTTTIAGVDLQDNITKTELQGALDLGKMAYANTATGQVGSQTITGVTASYTPAGTVSKPNITITPTESTVKVALTEGSVVSGSAASLGEGFYNVGTAPTFTEGTFTANTPTVIDTTKFSGGSKTADTFSAGTLPTLGEATTGAFATAGITAEVGTGDDAETLIFTAASTSNAVTAQGTFTQGSLPSFTEGAFTPAELQAGFYTAGTAASKAADTFNAGSVTTIDTTKFNGGTATQVVLPTFDDATVVTGASAELAAAPTFTGTVGTATVADITVAAKNVTVTPDE